MGDHEETDLIHRQSRPLQHIAGSTEGLDIRWGEGGDMENKQENPFEKITQTPNVDNGQTEWCDNVI